ncbi:LysM peptidoglycan-binding domain-containing protein [Mesorhizobium sp. CGMCC 1.15528]|uniref:LysM peptidoglycan-binding domain-containing protein n=1 Tax=Mesorhizobium zhangyense TaxID=1776730 RepID=A0A7C9VAW5_9HYPH|nr:LysM peptidoglycan-binding domain-containing protein [Mesorhizobium zhangyense]NGN40712.1 LysM peptidoglycan-binding domain-containing protein [Mesorhizobium zhangyense]
MAVTAIRALLFLAGGTAAAVGTAYVSGALDPYLGKTPPMAASLSDTKAPEADTKAARLPSQPAAPETQTPKAEQPAAEAPSAGAGAVVAPGVSVPSFDVVRAEPDGSVVIAGKAAPNSKVEIVIGSKIIGNGIAGPEGDFAVVVEEPLKPGDHQIVLRSTTPDNVVATSPETAVVSIPENKSGQVLALVEQPGAASKLISIPEPEPAAKPTESASTSTENAPTPPATAPAGQTAAAPTTEQPASQQAAAAPQPEKPAAAPAPASGPTVKVEAVEIEGRKVFIAGAADPGRKVRAYANDILLGEVITSPGGRFLIETERDLPVGDYIVRVDGLEPDGVKVAARAAVPFTREPGEAVAAVAPADSAEQPKPAQSETAAAPAQPGAPAATAEASPTTPPPAGSGEIAAVAPEALSPKLQSVDSAVIIRRGDSLWRISRRVYGLGVRYSTIYLANQEQIRDPNRIWPGQVFKVPEKTDKGEAADMKTIGDQATTTTQ